MIAPRAAAWILTAVMAITVCWSIARIPVQVTDSLVPILQAQQTSSVSAAFLSSLGAAYLRPMRMAQIQALFEASRGEYFLTYKLFHVALALACFALFLAVLDIRAADDVVALVFALTALTGLHTFRGMVWEAYPINHFLEITVFCLLALALARSRGGWWADTGAALAFVIASLTLESGLLVWVVVASAWLAGWRGISKRGVIAVTVLLIVYLLVRFLYLGTGSPTLAERSSGFGFGRLDPGELTRRFGAWPYGFYAYNVLSSLLTVLVSEPRNGTWDALAALSAGRFPPGVVINVVSSLVTTGVIAWFAWTRAGAWRARQLDDRDRICLVSMAVIVANAIVSYGYTKDEIMSAAGVFYALAVFVGIGELLRRVPATAVRQANVACIAVAVAASGWAIRSAGLHYQMQVMAFSVRNEWVYVDEWLARQRASPPTDDGRRIVAAMRNNALARTVVNPYVQAQSARALRLFP